MPNKRRIGVMEKLNEFKDLAVDSAQDLNYRVDVIEDYLSRNDVNFEIADEQYQDLSQKIKEMEIDRTLEVLQTKAVNSRYEKQMFWVTLANALMLCGSVITYFMY